MKYKYLNTNRVNSALKKHKIKVTSLNGKYVFCDLNTNVVLRELPINKLYEYTMDQWRTAAIDTRSGSVSNERDEAEARVNEMLEAI